MKGVASMLAEHADRVVVVEYDIAAPVLSGVEALEAIHAGETLTSSDVELGDAVVGHGDWPGRFAGAEPAPEMTRVIDPGETDPGAVTPS